MTLLVHVILMDMKGVVEDMKGMVKDMKWVVEEAQDSEMVLHHMEEGADRMEGAIMVLERSSF
jgi:hypothetical protein